jgi:hypothetical protein
VDEERDLDDVTIVAMAQALIALDLPAECVAGVRANLVALAEHVARVAG